MDLNTIWFLILGCLAAAYLVLDGYDLGIGVIHLFTGEPSSRDQFLRLIGPYWDGNEVWLIIAGGVLFAVFPGAYAGLLSGFYPYFIGLLLALIIRGIAIDLRGKCDGAASRRLWDLAFGVASLAALAIVGAVGANLAGGVATDNHGMVLAQEGAELGLSTIVGGLLSVALFTMHGALHAAWKASTEQQKNLKKWALASWACVLALTGPAAALNINTAGVMGAKWHPALFGAAATLLVLALLYVPWLLSRDRYGRAFLCSTLVIIQTLVVLAMLLYPRLLRSTVDDNLSLTVYNAAATRRTMVNMLIILAVSLPPAIGYMVFVRLSLQHWWGNSGR